MCENSCEGFSNDGVCQDGGSRSKNSLCEFGSDCSDCGPRVNLFEKCINSCVSNGVCEDGGQSQTIFNNICDFGTDCADCGVRFVEKVCENDCTYTFNERLNLKMKTIDLTFNNECEDTSIFSLYKKIGFDPLCDFGFDCQDCGIVEIPIYLSNPSPSQPSNFESNFNKAFKLFGIGTGILFACYFIIRFLIIRYVS